MKNIKNTTHLTITLSPEIITKIKEGNYNRNALLVSLLRKHVTKQVK